MQQIGNADGFGYDHLGDLTIVTKYALINDRETGNVLSGGLAITAPTSPTIRTSDGSVYLARSIKLERGRVCVNDDTAGEFSMSVRDILEIRR